MRNMRNMKRTGYVVILMAAVLLLSVVGCGTQTTAPTTTAPTTAPTASGGAAATQPITIKFSYAPPVNGFYGQIYDYLAKTVEEESKGQLKLQVYPGGTLVSDQQILDAVTQGNVDIGHFMVAYIDNTIKELTPFEIPGAYPSSKFVELDKAARPGLNKVFNKYGLHYLGPVDIGFVTLAANKKIGIPITAPEQMKGHTVRTAGKWNGEVIKLWGGSPVTIPMGDLPNALQLGTIDISNTGFDLVTSLKLYEIAPNVTKTDLSGNFGGLIMNDKAWNKLNSDQQAALTRAAEKWVVFNHQLAVKSGNEFENQVKKGGAKLAVLSPEQNADFRKASAQALEQVKGISGSDGQEFIKIFEGLK